MSFFSVVIPLFNKESFVAKTIESVLAQTFTDFEVIVVDDCSNDNSLSIVKGFDDKRIRIVSHDVNKGLSASRNTGVKHAKSELIAFLDADDLWKPFFLEKMHELIERFPAAGIFAVAYQQVYPGNVVMDIHRNIDFAEDEMRLIDNFFEIDTHQPILWYGCATVRKTVFDTVGGFDQTINYGEDTDFNIRANLKFKLAYRNTVCASYTIYSQNQITTESIARKTITDFNKYEVEAIANPSLKKYLDLNRYFLASYFRLAGNTTKFKQLVLEIDRKNLTGKQRLLIDAPLWLLKLLKNIKGIFLKKGIRLTTFRN